MKPNGNLYPCSPHRKLSPPRLSLKWLGNALAHGYIWVWLAIFALPFLSTLTYSLRSPQGEWTLSAYQYVFGSFKDNLLLSFETTFITIIINLLISVPAAFAIVRYPIPGKSFLLSTLNLSLIPRPLLWV